MKSKSLLGRMKRTALLGIAAGVFFFILTQAGVEIPIVVGTTSYEGMRSSLLLLIGFPIVISLVGFVVSLFLSMPGKK
ncbi:hypothetical protein [Gorillibacterium timonense]|uniref:hypothetical protein n=1 Tax=Gorillibacterium timonense TaxID=1689269 RepID=UPI00071DC00F|nr:hypothetical protein [Gorillibacterium timonense]